MRSTRGSVAFLLDIGVNFWYKSGGFESFSKDHLSINYKKYCLAKMMKTLSLIPPF